MRKVSHPEGAEFSHEDHAAWEELTVLQGQVVEVLLSETGEDFPPDLWGGFLVIKVELGLEGDMILYAKSLGCDDPESTRWLITNFNRRAGCLHLCHSYPCEVEGEFSLHVTRLRLFSPEGFARNYMTSAVKKQMKKWLDQLEDELTRPSKGLDITVPMPDGDMWEHVEALKSTAKAHPPAPPGRLEERISESKRKELRKRLDDAKARMSRSAGVGAGAGAELPPREIRGTWVARLFTLSSGREGGLAQTSTGRAEGTSSPQRPRDCGTPGDRRRRGEGKRKEREEEKGQGSRKTTCSGYKRYFYRKLAGSASESGSQSSSGESWAHPRRKRKSQKEGPQHCVGEVATTSRWWRKEEEKEEEGQEEPEVRPLPGGELRRSEEKEEEGSWRAGLQPELLEWQWPDELLRSQLQRSFGGVVEQLRGFEDGATLAEESEGAPGQRPPIVGGTCQSTAGSELESGDREGVRQGLHGSINAQVREMHHLSSCMDALREGALDHVGDLLAARFISLHQSLLDGNWTAARQLELLPLEETSAAGP